MLQVLGELPPALNETSQRKKNAWDVVVARYQEDISWLDPIRHKVHVYDKGGHQAPIDHGYASWTTLPNTGREGATYLRHILDTYGKAGPDVTVFVQGRIDDHLPPGERDPLAYVMKMAEEAAAGGASVPRFRIQLSHSWRHKHYLGKALHVCDLCLGDWIERYIQVPFPHGASCVAPFYMNGIFAVTAGSIRARNREYYQEVLQQLDAEDPEAGHYLERCWAIMFPRRP